jgi:hypothetical protein
MRLKAGDRILVTKTTSVSSGLKGQIGVIIEAPIGDKDTNLPYRATLDIRPFGNLYWVDGVLLTPLLKELV